MLCSEILYSAEETYFLWRIHCFLQEDIVCCTKEVLYSTEKTLFSVVETLFHLGGHIILHRGCILRREDCVLKKSSVFCGDGTPYFAGEYMYTVFCRKILYAARRRYYTFYGKDTIFCG